MNNERALFFSMNNTGILNFDSTFSNNGNTKSVLSSDELAVKNLNNSDDKNKQLYESFINYNNYYSTNYIYFFLFIILIFIIFIIKKYI